MADVCFYHGGGCADGWCAAWVVKKAYPDCELVPVKYGSGLPPIDKYSGRDVMIVDFSYPPDELEAMAADAMSVVMLDHHASAIEKWAGEVMLETMPLKWARCPNTRIVFDIRHSGAKLAWNFLNPHRPTPLVVQYVQDRDLWKWELPDSHAVNAYIRTQPMTVEAWGELCKSLQSDMDRKLIVQLGRMILAREKQIVDGAVRNAVNLVVADRLVPVVNTTEMISEVGNELCKGRPFAVMYQDDLKRGLRVLSFRSCENGEDVSKIAATFGGGGHKHAAGATIPLGQSFYTTN
jgi:uncharacterized protein